MQPPPPSRRALVGFSGFVGQHLLSQTDFTDLYRSTNIASIATRRRVRAARRLRPPSGQVARQQGSGDRLAHRAGAGRPLIALLRQAGHYYLDDRRVRAARRVHRGRRPRQPNHAYGKHRLWFEKELRRVFPTCLVVRIPALFGQHLKKNMLYDCLHGRLDMLARCPLESSFQWYNRSGFGRTWSMRSPVI